MSADESYLLVFLIYVYGRWRDLLFIMVKGISRKV